MNATSIVFQLPWAIIVAALKLSNANRWETTTLFNGAKLTPRGGGWYMVYGYHYNGHDVTEIYNSLMDALMDRRLDSPLDMKKWRIHAHA